MSGPFMPEWLQKVLAPADASRTKQRTQYPEIPKIGPLAARNDPRYAYTPGKLDSPVAQTAMDFVPGLGAARGIHAAREYRAGGGSLPLALAMGGLSAIPEMGAAAKVGERGLSKLLGAIMEHKAGGTLTAAGERFAGTGFAVADPRFTIKSANQNDLRAFFSRKDVRQALSEGKHIGTWTDPETHITEVNLSDILQDRQNAISLGRSRNEKAIGHLANGEYQGDVSLAHEPFKAPPGPLDPMTGEPLTVAGRAPGTRSPDAISTPGGQPRPPIEFQGGNRHAGEITNLTERIARKKKQLLTANGEYADQLDQDVQIMADRIKRLQGEGIAPEAKQGEALADSVVSRAAHLPSTGRTLPLDVSINPEGVDASRPPLYRPKKADLSVLDAVKRRTKSVYTPAAERGLRDNPTGAAWYDMSPLRQAFEGESATGSADFKKFMDLMGPTSAGTNVPMNMRQASYFYHLWKQGKLTPEMILNRGVAIPEGYGNRLRIAESLHKVLFGEGLNPITTPKTFRYSNQLGGRSWGGVALDRHVGRNIGVEGMMDGGKSSTEGISRAFPEAGFGKTGKVSSSPDNNHYAAIEDAMVSEAGKLGVHPAAYQAAGWVGNAAKTGVEDARHPIEILNQKLEDTAAKYGYKNGSDALRAFIRGKTPLWALGGVTVGGGLMGQDEE